MTGRPQVCVGAVVVHDGALLLVRRGHAPEAGRWSIPGGRVEAGEPLWEAVVREVREEAGIDVAVDGLAGWAERLGDPAAGDAAGEEDHFVILDFFATPMDPAPRLRAGDDATDAAWIALEEVPEQELVDGLAEFLVDAGVIADTRPFGIHVVEPAGSGE